MGDPTISLLVPVYHPVISELRECIDSVRDQTYPSWELCLALDGPQPPEVRAAIESYDDPRLLVNERAENGGISAASNDALALATGEFVGLLDNDDTLAPWALERMVQEIAAHPDADFLYSDEDKLDENGRRLDHFPKPGWSPERLRSHMYTGHFTVYRTDLVRRVGGFRSDYDGSQDHDLALRVSEEAREVVHIPEVLYHWRMSINSAASGPDAKPWAYDAGLRAIQSHLDRVGIDAEATKIEGYPGYLKYEPRSAPDTTVSIVIVTGGRHRVVRGETVRLVDQAIASILGRSTFAEFEIIVVLDQHADLVLEHDLQAMDPRVRVVRDHAPFNYSAANNLGASWAGGELIVFLNDDIEVITPNWLERMAMFALLPGVGAVGARLDFADGRIQHAGIMARTVPQHRARGAKHPYYGLMGGLQVATHNVSAVTGACLMVRRDRFFDVGGFPEDLPLSYNDVDLCFRFLHAGLRNILDMHTRLFHFESSSRQPDVRPDELSILQSRWGRLLRSDPYDNPIFDHSTSEEKPPPAILTMLQEWGHERAPARALPNPSYQPRA